MFAFPSISLAGKISFFFDFAFFLEAWPNFTEEIYGPSKEQQVKCLRECKSEMTLSTRSWMHDITCTLNNVKEHIRANHMYPGEQGKSCFLSTCDTTVWKMVVETFLNPDVTTPHRSDGKRIVLRKKFSWPVGVHGRNGALCFFVTVIYDQSDRRIVTAFPTKWILKTLF